MEAQNIHLGVEHSIGQRLLKIADQATRFEHRIRVPAGQQLIEKLCRERLLCLCLCREVLPRPAGILGLTRIVPETPGHMKRNMPLRTNTTHERTLEGIPRLLGYQSPVSHCCQRLAQSSH